MRGLGVATLTAALLGWAALVLAARQLGAEGFAQFSVAWGLFFSVGGVCAGLQQEVTRSVTLRAGEPEGTEPGSPVAAGTLIVAFGGVVLLAAAAPAWVGAASGGGVASTTVVAVCVGLVGIAVMTAVNGVLTAHRQWRLLSVSVAGDQILRLLALTLVLVVLPEGTDPMWAVISGSFVWVALLPTAGVRRAVVARGRDPLWGMLRRSGMAMAGAGLSALLVTGFPLLLHLTSRAPLDSSAGVVLAAVVATRTPILMPLYGMRPVVLSHLLQRRSRLLREVRRLLAGTALLGLPAVAAAAVLGPSLLRLMFGADFIASPGLLASLTAGAVLLAMLTETSIALIVVDRHRTSTLGWLVAVIATTALLALPLPVSERAVWGLLGGPLAGLLHHAAMLGRVLRVEHPPTRL